MIIHNSFVCYTGADSPKELNENRYILLPHHLCIYSIIQFKRETLGMIEKIKPCILCYEPLNGNVYFVRWTQNNEHFRSGRM